MSPSPTPCSKQGRLQRDWVSQSPVQPDLGCFQGWDNVSMGWMELREGHPRPEGRQASRRLTFLSRLLAGELPEALTHQVLQVQRVAEEELPASAEGGAQHPAGSPVPVAGGGAASGRGSQGAAPSPHLPAQPEAPSGTGLPRNGWPPEMNLDQPS